MTALATPPMTSLPFSASNQEKRDFAAELRSQTVACRVFHQKFGVRKALTREQLAKTAEQFEADPKSISAGKKLLDTRDPKFRAVVQIRGRAGHYWKACTTPYPEAGTRLIRRDKVERFNETMRGFREELAKAVAVLEENYSDLREQAKERLGDLFSDADYPDHIASEFSLDWDFPSVDPPQMLKDLHPQLYQQEVDRIRGRFEEAIRLTEEAFATQFQKLVAHLAEKLKPGPDGKSQTFKDSSVANLTEFFEQFRQLDTGSNEGLQKLVDQAQAVVKGATPDELRDNQDLRQKVAGSLAEIQSAMDGLLVARPKRAISLEDEA